MLAAESVSNVTVIGAGTMGALIAGEFARCGCAVCLHDLNAEILNAGMARLAGAQEALLKADLLTREQAESARARITPLSDLEKACSSAEVLVEAATENMSVKQELFRCLDRFSPRDAILASNTSGLSITEIGAATARPQSVAGLHFWNPAHIIPLVEVTLGSATELETGDLLMALMRRIGKRPILVRHDVPGFVGNRLQFAVLREALDLLDRGIASAEDIDTAMTAGPGLRYGFLGPLRTADLGGLDVFAAISRYLFADLADRKAPSEILEKLVAEGKFGTKTGAGFYEYAETDAARIIAERDRVLQGFLKVLRTGPE
jgi:3-hydroxybutyryl-CoA dehydrogenase